MRFRLFFLIFCCVLIFASRDLLVAALDNLGAVLSSKAATLQSFSDGTELHTEAKRHISLARSCFLQALRLNPVDVRAHLGLGRIHLWEGDFSTASVLFHTLSQLNPGHVIAHYYLGNAYAGMGRKADAVREWLIAGTKPTMLGDRALEERRYGDAVAEYTLVLEMCSHCTQAYIGLGRAYAHQNKWDQAILAFQKALSIDAENAEALTELGYAYYSGRGDIDSAVSFIERAIAYHPNLWSMLVIGDIYKANGDFLLARHWYEQAASFAPEVVLPKKKLGEVLLLLGQWPEAVKVLTDVVMQAPENAEGHWLLAEAYFQGGMGEQACLEYRCAIQLGEGKVINQTVLGKLESLCNSKEE